MTFPAGTIRAFQYGLGILTLTAIIGLFNATKLIGDIDRNTLLTHLHSGTLGWITMGVFGIALALFARNGAAGPNILLTALATAGYVLASWSPPASSNGSWSRTPVARARVRSSRGCSSPRVFCSRSARCSR